MPDCPENNFGTFITTFKQSNSQTFTYGSRQVTTSSGGRPYVPLNIRIPPDSNKWFWEFRVNDSGAGMGIMRINQKPHTGVGYLGAAESVTSTGTGTQSTDGYYGDNHWVHYSDNYSHNGSATSLSGSNSYPEVLGCLFDSTSGSENIAWYRGGTAIGNVNVDAGFEYIPVATDGSI